MGADKKAKLLIVAPFCDVTSFHEEYQIQCSEKFVAPEEVACESEFRLAFDHLHKTEGVRLQSAKGGFNTCEICYNCKELSRNKRINNNKYYIAFIFIKIQKKFINRLCVK